MSIKVIIWDHDGTIVGLSNPNAPSTTIMPNVEKAMNAGDHINFVCTGTKTADTESTNFDPQKIMGLIKYFQKLLPIEGVTFSPAIGGTECYLVTKNDDNSLDITKAHENPEYQHLIGQFKKPGIGMIVVLKDLIKNEYYPDINFEHEVLFIGDTWQDKQAAIDSGLHFINANDLHDLPPEVNIDEFLESYINQRPYNVLDFDYGC